MGCGGDTKSGTEMCHAVCVDVCKALVKCAVGDIPPTCADDCTAGLGSSDCSNSRPADQLTCAELKNTYDVATYCATACHRAPECGTFDEKFCNTGCAHAHPAIHNPKSVAARTCDQLKPEVRDYEDQGRVLAAGGDVGGLGGISGGTNPYGLCERAGNCELPLGCSLDTNTCAPCATNAECDRSDGEKYLCTTDKECLSVQCLDDSACPGTKCDPERHSCVECLADADCNHTYSTRCDTTQKQCVQCFTDADCTSAIFGSKCDATQKQCVQCLTDADCTEINLSTCDPQYHLCAG
jgi:hypothetical protein